MQQSDGNRPLTIAIAGGGIAGVCLALGMLEHARDVRIHIYEAAPKFQEVGAGVSFGINAQRALWKLCPRAGAAYADMATSNADFAVENAAADAQGMQKGSYVRLVMGMDHATNPDYKAGRAVCEVFCEGGFSSVHRASFLDRMVRLLPEHIQEHCASFGRRVIGVEDVQDGPHGGSTGVRLLFADGGTALADAVVGCDGIKSYVRRDLLGCSHAAHPTFTGKFAYRGLIPMDRAVAVLGEKLARNAHHHIGYGGHVLTFPIDHGNTLNVVAFRTKHNRQWQSDEWVKPATNLGMQRDFQYWGREIQAILQLMERCDQWALFDQPPASTYHRQGRICLIGDAAHASTPHQGAGAGMALEDAYVLSCLIGQVRETKDLQRAFGQYEAVRKQRTQSLVQSSREQAALYDLEAQGVGDDVQKIAEILPHRWDWIWDYDIEAALADAKNAVT